MQRAADDYDAIAEAIAKRKAENLASMLLLATPATVYIGGDPKKSDSRVEQSLYRRAGGYSYGSEKIMGYTPCIFWLKSRLARLLIVA